MHVLCECYGLLQQPVHMCTCSANDARRSQQRSISFVECTMLRGRCLFENCTVLGAEGEGLELTHLALSSAAEGSCLLWLCRDR